MGFFRWLARLFGGKRDETPGDVADRIERFADRYRNAGDQPAAFTARTAADEARHSPTAAAARQIETEYLRKAKALQAKPIKPVIGTAPDNTVYVRYRNSVRSGGSRAWRYNNPGYVRCNSRSTYYGAIGCDGEYAIFPDHHTGVLALRKSLRDEYPNDSFRVALQKHLPSEAQADPDHLCEQAGLDPEIKVSDVTDDDCLAIAPAFESQPGWSAGDEYDRGATECPEWVGSTWETTNATDPVDSGTGDPVNSTSSTDAVDPDTGDPVEVAPTDNS